MIESSRLSRTPRPTTMRLHSRILSSLSVICAVFGYACDSEDPVRSDPPPPDPVWSEITSLPPPLVTYALWAANANLLIGAGMAGQIWQWDGQHWARRINTSPEDLHAIAGSSLDSLLVVGDNGAILQHVNGSFIERDGSTREDLRGVWRSPSGSYVVVGLGGTILRGNGTIWSADPAPSMASLFSVWGASENDVFAAGVNGTILHFDGSTWSAMPTGTGALLTALSGTAPDDVYAVGSAGTILHYDGASWTPMSSATTDLLQSVCAECGPAAAGANGTVVRLADGAWQRETMVGAPWLYSITRAGDNNWAAGAYSIFRHDGVAWSHETRGAVPILRGITYAPAHGIVAVGEDGRVMRGGPSHWITEDAGGLQRLNAVWTSPSGEVLAAGSNHIFRLDDGQWVIENQELIEYFDIDGNRQDAFAVGGGGAIRRRAGTSWVPMASGRSQLNAIVMRETEGYIAGHDGLILRYDGSQWVQDYVKTGKVLLDIAYVESTRFFDVLAVGEGGVCFGHVAEAGSWAEVETGVTTALHALGVGPDGLLYAAGANGTIIRRTYEAWTPVASPTSRTFLGAWSRSGALYLCGGDAVTGGMLFRYGPPDR